MASDDAIRTALMTRLGTLTLSPAKPVAWENTDFEPANGGWIEPQLFRSGKERITVGGRHRHFGFLQVTVVAPKGAGDASADATAALVAAHFPADLKLAAGGFTVRITEDPALAGGLPDGSWWRVPVSIPWELYD